MQREDGILTMTLDTDGGAFVWSFEAHEEMGLCFAEVSGDRDNNVVVMCVKRWKFNLTSV